MCSNFSPTRVRRLSSILHPHRNHCATSRIVRPPQFFVLLLQRPQPSPILLGQSIPSTRVNLHSLHPAVQGLGRASNLARDRHRRSPPRPVVFLVFKQQPYGPFPDLRGITLRFVHAPILSRSGASGKPGSIQSWLTSKECISEDRKVDMFLAVGLARIDNVFMKSRRLFSALERPRHLKRTQHRLAWLCAVQPSDA